MKRRTLDVLFSVGGLVLAGLLLMAGLVLTSNANFSSDYVASQLSDQKIKFKAADALTADEKTLPCLTTYAGQDLTTGKQAECYANYIGVHVSNLGKGTYGDKYTGMTYAELGGAQGAVRPVVAEAGKALAAANEKVTLAKASGDPALPALQTQAAAAQATSDAATKELGDVTAQRETVFKGESLRSMLLTAYGFGELGTKAGQAATVVYLAAALMLLLSIFGFIHAWMTPRTEAFAAPESARSTRPMVNA
jgi:hypothetical protein